MLGIVLPPVASPTRQGGHTISPTNAASTTNPANSADAPGAANPAGTSDSTSATNSTGTTDSTGATNSTGTTDSTGAAKVAAIPTASDWIGRAVSVSDIGVAVEVVVAVDGNVVISAPPAAPSPTPAPESAHRYAHAEGNRHSGGVVSPSGIIERVVGIDGRTVHHHRIVGRHIDHLWVRLLDYDHGLVLDDFGLDFLLFGRLQVSLVLGFLAHALHGIHYIALLREEGIAYIRGPLNIVCQSFDYIRQSGHGLDACVPRLFCDRIGERFVLEILVTFEPLLKLDDFEGVG
jgi:hypothetical protein